MLKIVFFGTPEYVVPIVESLNKSYKNAREKGLVAVVTQPPRPAGRGNKLQYSAVDTWAYKHNTDIIHDLNDVPVADVGVVAAYGKIIPLSVIDKFKYGILNIHPSLLPKYRGASPIQETLKNQDKITGLTVIRMDEKMDHGPIVSSFKYTIEENDDAETLRVKLFEKSADFLIELLPHYIDGKIQLKQQDHDQATYTKIVSKEDGFIESVQLNEDPERVLSLIKAMYPWPGVWTLIDIKGEQKRLKILKANEAEGKLVIEEAQLEGKNPVKWSQLIDGYPEIKKQLSRN